MPPGHLPVRSYLAVPVVSRTGEVDDGLFFGHAEVGVFRPGHEALLVGIPRHAATAIGNARLVHDLQCLNANLEQRVAAEVAERLEAEEMLRQSQKLEALGQLTGGVAHDFDNLLMVISSGINIIERADDLERRGMVLGRMRESIERGAELTQQLLAVSRKQELKPENIALAELLAGMSVPVVVEEVRRQLPQRHLAWPLWVRPHRARSGPPQGGQLSGVARAVASMDLMARVWSAVSPWLEQRWRLGTGGHGSWPGVPELADNSRSLAFGSGLPHYTKHGLHDATGGLMAG
jgi:hypothetical protein